jgi:trans-aconitate methyltransferase
VSGAAAPPAPRPPRPALGAPADVRAYFRAWQRRADPALAAELDAEAHTYLAYHARRYLHLVQTIDAVLREQGRAERPRLLDIGPNYQTELLRAAHPEGTVDTLGFAHPSFPPGPAERHVHFDLNDAYYRDRWPEAPGHDVVVMAEVIEHLHTSPVTVLQCVSTWLAPGGVVVIQTPNACALHKRLRMLAGRNPYEPIRGSRDNPGHFHEYTPSELREAAAEAGLRVARCNVTNYFEPSTPGARLYNAAGRLLPSSLRHGITICLERTA